MPSKCTWISDVDALSTHIDVLMLFPFFFVLYCSISLAELFSNSGDLYQPNSPCSQSSVLFVLKTPSARRFFEEASCP